jgi:uncharacterized surface protein with fasciclin (FAS1) repeats
MRRVNHRVTGLPGEVHTIFIHTHYPLKGNSTVTSRLLIYSLAILGFSAAAAPFMNAGEAHKKPTKDIIETAIAAGNFKTLATALGEAGLIETLKGAGPFTVFAPTDDAFAKVPKADLDNLLKNREQLKKVLLYHVVAGKIMSADVIKLKSATTVEGSKVTINTKGKNVMINSANVIAVDVEATNGVIHVIDTVIMPPAEKEE